MKKLVASSVCLTVSIFCSTVPFAQPDEEIAVRLMLIDALVFDAAGKPVRGLTKDDFQMTVRNEIKAIDTLDEICAEDRAKIPGAAKRTVLAFDYYGLTQPDRTGVVEAAADLLRDRKQPDEQVMIVSMTNALRVEQRFTADLELLLDTLERMEYDITLAATDFGYLTGEQYFGNIATMLDVLAAYEGTKAVILYSATVTAPGATDDLYRDLTTRAAIGGTIISTAGLAGLDSRLPRPGQRFLSRIATDTGGLVGDSGSDARSLYDDIQVAHECRYSLGFYLEANRAQAPEDIVVTVAKPDVTVRYPAQVRLWSVEETRASRERAAFADPEQFGHTLVRTIAYPAGPSSSKKWNTVVAIHVPLPVGPDGETLDVSAKLYRNREEIADFSRQLKFDAPASGAKVQPFTLFGEAVVPKGEHELRVVLSKPGEKQVVASSARFNLPQVPWGDLMLRGPLLARVEKEGLAIRTGEAVGALLRKAVGDLSFEPLTVHEIETSDTLLAGWQACRAKKKDARESGARVERVIVDLEGNRVHELPSLPLQLEGGKVKCHKGLDKIEPGTLEPGEYTFEVAVMQDGEAVLQESTPLLVD